jgi:hypothetical protein
LKLAAIPLVIGAVVVFGGIALSLAVDQGSTTIPSAVAPTKLPGQQLAGIPAKGAIAAIASLGQPPANIVAALTVPSGASVTSHRNSSGLGPFDRSITLAIAAPPAQVVSFFEAEMTHHHWSLLAKVLGGTAGSSSDQLFYQLGGSDGYYWQVGLTLTASSPSLTPALGGGNQTGPGTTAVMEIDQAQDPD